MTLQRYNRADTAQSPFVPFMSPFNNLKLTIT